jgi:hypothetical protein
MRRETHTISAMAGIRFAISRSAIIGGDNSDPGFVPRLSNHALNAAMTTSITAMAAAA